MRARITYTCDWVKNDDQGGRITVEHPEGGKIEATWDSLGGMPGETTAKSNTTPWTDAQAEEIVNTADICQGIGTYTADLIEDEHGWFDVDNVEWEDEDEDLDP